MKLDHHTATAASCRLGVFAVFAAFVATTALIGHAQAADKVVVAHSAGINGNAVEAILKDYTAQTGVEAVGITMSDTDYGAKLQLAAKTGNVNFDVALGVGADIYQLVRGSGIFAKIDTSAWKKSTLDAMREAKLIGSDFAVSSEVTATLVYSPKFEKDPPKSWADFFDTTKYPGNRGMASGGFGVLVNLEYALIASGKKADNLYPIDIKAAIAQMSKISNQLVLWDNAPNGIQSLVNGDTSMTICYSPAAMSAVKNGQSVKVVQPYGTAVLVQLGVVAAKAPDGDKVAQQFLEWWFRPAQQKKFAELTGFGVVVPSKEILAQFTPEQSAYMAFSGAHPENFHVLDADWYAKSDGGENNMAKVLSAWNQFRSK
jgi:putative spermidine/putrescine transport system substrate-binding protein